MAIFAGNVKLKHFLLGAGGLVASAMLWVVWQESHRVAEPPPLETPLIAAEAPEAVVRGTEVRPGVTITRGLETVDDPGSRETDTEAPTTQQAEPPGAETETPATTPAAADDAQLRAVDRDVLRWKNQPMNVKKRKDVSKGAFWKINVYRDDPGGNVNRAKVDLDRDDNWDEKFTFEPEGGVTRKVSPADDGEYTEVYRLTDAGWVLEGG